MSLGRTLCFGLAPGTPPFAMLDKHFDLFDRYLQIIGFEYVGGGVEPRA